MQERSGFLLSNFAPPIITGRRGNAGMAGQLLHRRNIRPRIKQVTNKRPSHIVGRKSTDPGQLTPFFENVKDSLAAHLLA